MIGSDITNPTGSCRRRGRRPCAASEKYWPGTWGESASTRLARRQACERRDGGFLLGGEADALHRGVADQINLDLLAAEFLEVAARKFSGLKSSPRRSYRYRPARSARHDGRAACRRAASASSAAPFRRRKRARRGRSEHSRERHCPCQAFRLAAFAMADPLWSHPITGNADCCARAASGRAA
jgi:hypothetical protein